MSKDEYEDKTKNSEFFYLTPLFRDPLSENILPPVPLTTLLRKFDGVCEKEYKTFEGSQVKRFQVMKLPAYLILCYKRFTNNTSSKEKNPTMANFSTSDLDLTDLLDPSVRDTSGRQVYDLVANIVHSGEPD